MIDLKSALIIIPTYNERESIAILLPEIFHRYPDISVLVVDDSSPDKTSERVRELSQRYSRLYLCERKMKEGLGPAYRAGFDWALEKEFQFIVQMDADGSHRPQDLEKILQALSRSDLVVGSRRVRGGAVKNWEWYRRVLSWAGSAYASLLLRYPVRDWTGGFNGWRRKVLERVSYATCSSQGYSFQIELKLSALRLNFSAEEVPIIFEERKVGQSKMSGSIIIEALHKVWTLRQQKTK